MHPPPIIEKDGILVVTFDDVSSLNEGLGLGIRQTLYRQIEANKGIRVAFDLSQIDYVSSTGIALLVGTKRRIEAAQGKLVLFGLHPDVLELFTSMKLASLFEIVEDEAQAIELLPPLASE